MKRVPVKNFWIGPKEPLAIMCGPCVIESEAHALAHAEAIQSHFKGRPFNLIFKASFDKANRSSFEAFRGPGLEEGCRILEKIKVELNLPIITDVHTVEQASVVGKLFECVQIPAFLCRQTDLLTAAAASGAVISVKKGQFMAPLDMKNVVQKIQAAHNDKIILVERGVTFGYNNLVVDFRSIPQMQSLGVPVCFDATHSVQLPGGLGNATGGESQYIPMLAKASIIAGANCLFIEAHSNPKNAKSDAACVLDLAKLPKLLDQLEKLYEISRCDG
jgi:2-dehydro-3-deoxyphosphooctonate aldolase (KDO 8-P synthase)